MKPVVPRSTLGAIKPLALTIAIAAAFPFSTFGQTAQERTLAPVLVTSTRSPQSVRDVPGDSIFIASEEIEQSGLVSLAELLQKKRGIEISTNGGPGTVSSVFVRGGSNNLTVVLIDGVRTSSSTSGGASWAAIPLSQIDHVEIAYGPLTTLYGADAVSGVIQIFTKKGDGAPRFTASIGIGSYATRSLEAGVSGSANGDHRFSYAISAAHEGADGFSATKAANYSFNADKDGYAKDSASGQFSLEVAKGHELGFSFLQSRLDTQFDDGTSAFDARTISRLGTVALSSKNQFLPNWNSQLKLSRSTDKSEFQTEWWPGTFNTTQDNLSWQNDLTIGSDLLQLIFERRDEKVDSDTVELVGKRSTNSVAASYLLKRGRHVANMSVRGDNSSQFGSHTTGGVAYAYHITETWRANASYGTSFRAPTFSELYYPYFGIPTNRPEEGKNVEVGLHYDDGKTQFNAAYYHNAISNLIVTTTPCPILPAVYTYGCSYNVNQALLSGVTIGGATRFGDFKIRASVDLQDPRDETTDKNLARRAKQHGSVALEYGAGRIKAGAEAVFSGKRFDDAANITPLSGYGLLNLYVGYEFGRDWSLFGRWNNALNKDYELASTYATPGSNVFVGLRYGYR
jgi:vitamin B12 transporter